MEKKWRITYCKSVWIHVSIHFTWSTNNLGLLLSCCTIEAIILKRKLVKDWMGNPLSPRLGEVLKGTTKDTLQLTDVLTGEAESLPICGTKLICKFWATAAQTLNSFSCFVKQQISRRMKVYVSVCVCLSIHIDLDVYAFLCCFLMFFVNIVKCHNFLNIETRENFMSSLKLQAVTMRWFHLEGLWAQHCNSLWFWRSCCRPESPPKWDENGFKVRSSSGVGALEPWKL